MEEFRGNLKAKLQIRNELCRQGLAEFLGTFVLVAFGDGAVAQFILGKGHFGTFELVCWAYGLAVIAGITVCGGVSGGHINPAVSLAMSVVGKISVAQLLVYMLAQYLGAMFAAACLFGVYHDGISDFDGGHRHTTGVNATAKIFATYPNPYLSTASGLGDQIFATFLFLVLILAIVDPRNLGFEPKEFPLHIGFTIVSIHMGFGINCGAAVNPARDLGPRILTAMAGYGAEPFKADSYWFWVPLLGPYIGAVLGALTYLLFVGIHCNGNGKAAGEENEHPFSDRPGNSYKSLDETNP